jgi:hypothetical protein
MIERKTNEKQRDEIPVCSRNEKKKLLNFSFLVYIRSPFCKLRARFSSFSLSSCDFNLCWVQKVSFQSSSSLKSAHKHIPLRLHFFHVGGGEQLCGLFAVVVEVFDQLGEICHDSAADDSC